MNFQLVHWAMRGSYNGSFVTFFTGLSRYRKKLYKFSYKQFIEIKFKLILKFNQKILHLMEYITERMLQN